MHRPPANAASTRILGLAVLAAIILGACGPDQLSKPDYIARANRVCASAASQSKTLVPPTTPAEIDSFVKQTRSIFQAMLDELRKFEPPADDRPTIDRMVGDLQKASDYLPQLATAARGNNQQTIQDLVAKIQAVSNDASQIATDYGLTSCVNPGGALPGGPTPTPSG